MFSVSASNPQRRFVPVLAGCAVLLACLLDGAPARAQAENEQILADYQERTAELLDWAASLVGETENERARTVLEEARRLHLRSLELAEQDRPLRAYDLARRAREAVWLAVRLAREAMSLEEQARARAEHFREVFETVRERALDARNEPALTALNQAETQARRARERYLAGDAKASLELLEQAEQLLQRARRLTDEAGSADRLEQELERTRDLIERAREQLGDRPDPEAARSLDDAGRALERARSHLAQGHPGRARRQAEMARRLAAQATGNEAEPQPEAIRRQIERWDDRAARLEERMEQRGNRRAREALGQAGEHRRRAAEFLGAGDPERALRQIRAAHQRLDQAEKFLR